jgi:ABC-type proline/glycine betaine transport system ATPase subunit
MATGSMDEAYYIGTKIAIISLGKCVVTGSRQQLEEILCKNNVSCHGKPFD